MKRMLCLAVLATVVGGGIAGARGPSGSNEGTKGKQANNVKCAKGYGAQGWRAYGGTNGAEVCHDTGQGIHGRFIVSREQGGYLGADGDRNNPGAATGYLRVDKSGPHCSKGKDQDATKSRTKGPASCQPG